MAAVLRVLYVDDEPALLDIGKLFLEKNGEFAIHTSISARDALEQIKTEHYDAIVSDYQMPDMDGIALLKHLKASGNTTPFIIFTGRGREEIVIEAINHGADFYIQKGGEPKSQFAELSNKIHYAVARRHAEEALLASVKSTRALSSRYEAIIAASNIGAWEYHPDTGYLWFSPEYFSMLGRTIRSFDLPGTNTIETAWIDLLHPDDKERAKMFFDLYLSNPDGMYEQYFRMLHKDGHWVWIWSRGKTLRDASGMPGSITVGTHTDVTERKQVEMALHSANQKLNLLSTIIRHDIKNQLTLLRDYLGILQKKVPDPAFEEYFSRIANAGTRISAMIQISKTYENIGVNAPVWQHIHTLVNTVADDIAAENIRYVNDLPAGSEVFADPLIVKVFYNLVENAVRYGGKITTLRFFVEECAGDLIIVCNDDGDGVAVGEKDKIFDRGFGKNSGMGLFLAREILSITGITIRETGEPGKGARFEMTVPKGMWRMAGAGG